MAGAMVQEIHPLYTKMTRHILLLFCRDPPRCLLLGTLGLDDLFLSSLGRPRRKSGMRSLMTPMLLATPALSDFLVISPRHDVLGRVRTRDVLGRVDDGPLLWVLER